MIDPTKLSDILAWKSGRKAAEDQIRQKMVQQINPNESAFEDYNEGPAVRYPDKYTQT